MFSRIWGAKAARRLFFFAALAAVARSGLAADGMPEKASPRQSVAAPPRQSAVAPPRQSAVAPPRQIVVRVSGEFLAPTIERPIDEVLAVDEEILGVRATGEARVQAQPQLVLVDDPHSAAFTVSLTGTIQSQTVGRKGPVAIHSCSDTHFTATKRVAFQPGRGFIGQPAEIDAQTNSRTERIVPDRRGALGRAIERRAWTRVAQSREQVSQIVRAKTEAKIQEAFDRLLASRLARVNWLASQRFALATALNVAGQPQYHCCTRAGCLQIAASSKEGEALAGMPATGRADPPVQIWVHEAVVGDQAASALRLGDLVRRRLRFVATPSTDEPPGRSYDLATIGDWFVVHSGSWQLPGESQPTGGARLADARLKD